VRLYSVQNKKKGGAPFSQEREREREREREMRENSFFLFSLCVFFCCSLPFFCCAFPLLSFSFLLSFLILCNFIPFLSCSVSCLYPSSATIKKICCHGHCRHETHHTLVSRIPVNSQPLIRLAHITLKATWLSLDFCPSISEFRWSQKSKIQREIYFHHRPEYYWNNGLEIIHNLFNKLGADCI
jgi:hypothetical protein